MRFFDESETLALAQRYLHATNAGDTETLRAMFVPGAVVWHNYDELEVPFEKSLEVLAWLRKAMADVAFAEPRFTVTPDGFVQRTVVKGTAPDGTAVRAPSCVVVSVDDHGSVTRVEEYIDPGQLAALSRRRR